MPLREYAQTRLSGSGLPVAVIKTARFRLIQLKAARDERDLRNLKGLHYKKGAANGKVPVPFASTINIGSFSPSRKMNPSYHPHSRNWRHTFEGDRHDDGFLSD